MPRRYLSEDYAGPGDADEDAADYLIRAQAALYRRTVAHYSRVTSPRDGGVYWHLYYKDERVNGGLGETEEDARLASWHAAFGHMAGVHRA